jgi:ribonuclease HI
MYLFVTTRSTLARSLTGCAGIKDWLPGWRKKGFRTAEGTRVKNSELVMYADALISKRKQASQKVEFEYVPGHSGEPGNEGADALAVRGCKLREADARNWVGMRRKLEKELKKKPAAVIAAPVDASVSPPLKILGREMAHITVWVDIRRHVA